MTDTEKSWLTSLIRQLERFGEAHLDPHETVDWETRWMIGGETRTLREWSAVLGHKQAPRFVGFSIEVLSD